MLRVKSVMRSSHCWLVCGVGYAVDAPGAAGAVPLANAVDAATMPTATTRDFTFMEDSLTVEMYDTQLNKEDRLI
jgi:hypothetical protein